MLDIEQLQQEYMMYEYVKANGYLKKAQKVEAFLGMLTEIYNRKKILQDILKAHENGTWTGKNKEELEDRLNGSNMFFLGSGVKA